VAVILGAAVAGTLWVAKTRAQTESAPAQAFAAATGFVTTVDAMLTVPALPSRWFANRESLVRWQQSLRVRLADLFGRAERSDRQPAIVARAALPAPPGIVRERLEFAGADGMLIPAILQYPKDKRERPAILVIPGHVPSGDSGLRQLTEAGDGDRAAAATALAQRGFVTLAFELRGFGVLALRQGAEHNAIAYNALLNGTFYKALVVGDGRRALEVLRSLPQVDTKRVGVTGVSMGGQIAMTLAALDESIAAIAASGYGGEAGLFDGRNGPDAIITHFCHIIPGTWSFLRKEDLALLLAPRPTLIVRGELEYKYDDLFVTQARAAWRSLDAPDRFELRIVPKRGLDFFVDETGAFFEQALGPR
jgi:dienelactone hydrolase